MKVNDRMTLAYNLVQLVRRFSYLGIPFFIYEPKYAIFQIFGILLLNLFSSIYMGQVRVFV